MLSTLANWMRRLEMTVDCYVFGRGWLKADLNHNLEETMMMMRDGALDSPNARLPRPVVAMGRRHVGWPRVLPVAMCTRASGISLFFVRLIVASRRRIK